MISYKSWVKAFFKLLCVHIRVLHKNALRRFYANTLNKI